MDQNTTSVDLISQLPIAVASMCLGRATGGHELEPKVKACADAGFKGIELFYECIKVLARRDEAAGRGTFEDNLLSHCRHFRELCDKYGLKVMCMQPFKNFEGLLSRQRHQEKMTKARLYMKFCQILGCDIVLVPSMFFDDPKRTTGGELVIDDFRELADLGAQQTPVVKIAYECMAWGGHVDTWQKAWAVVQKVDRPNFGLCIDTFHTLARVYGDPLAADGLQPNAMEALLADCREMASTLDVSKIWYIQLSDAVRPQPPLSDSHPWYNPDQKWHMQWSRNGRVFPLEPENGGYMPAHEILRTVVYQLGYRGWVSMEMFHPVMADPSPDIPRNQAQRAFRSWKNVVKEISLDAL